METTTPTTTRPGRTWNLGDRPVSRLGYGTMQLAGPGVMGPPADRDAAIAVLRAAVELGVTHIDTSRAYGPRITNQLIREALHPYDPSLVIATKVGAVRDPDGGWPPARDSDSIRRAVHQDLEDLGVERLDVVSLRLGDATGPQPESVTEAFETLVELQHDGLIAHLGVSNATAEQVAQAQGIAPIVCVQNLYNLAFRHDDDLVDRLARAGIAYVPFFPSAASPRSRPRRSPPSPLASTRHRRRWRSRGSSSARRTSCPSRGRRRWPTCATTPPPQS